MANLNKVFLIGNLTRDPEVRFTPSGTAVAVFGLAVNRRRRDSQSGEKREDVTFIEVEAWARQADLIGQYMSKGRPIFIEGRLKQDRWQTRDGQNRSKMLVVVENFQFLDSQSAPSGRQGTGDKREADLSQAPESPPPGQNDFPPDDASRQDDDIPF